MPCYFEARFRQTRCGIEYRRCGDPQHHMGSFAQRTIKAFYVDHWQPSCQIPEHYSFHILDAHHSQFCHPKDNLIDFQCPPRPSANSGKLTLCNSQLIADSWSLVISGQPPNQA